MPRADFTVFFTASMMFILIFMVCFLWFCRCCRIVSEKLYTPETTTISELSENTPD